MHTVIENMITRRSCRGYKPDMIPEDVLEEILKAGTYAATGMESSLRLYWQLRTQKYGRGCLR